MSSSTVTARDLRSPNTSPSETSALVATSVAVSKARMSIVPNRDKPLPFFVAVLEPHLDARHRQDARSRLWPLDEDDRVLEVRLEGPPLPRGKAPKAKKGERGHGDP